MKRVSYNNGIKAALAKAKAENIPLIAFHSHPEGYPPSVDDFNKAYENNYLLGVVAGHNGQIYVYNAPDTFVEDTESVQEDIAFAYRSGFDIDRAYQETFINYGLILIYNLRVDIFAEIPHLSLRQRSLAPVCLCWRHPCRLLGKLRQHPVGVHTVRLRRVFLR